MEFREVEGEGRKDVWLPPGSMMSMKGDARYKVGRAKRARRADGRSVATS